MKARFPRLSKYAGSVLVYGVLCSLCLVVFGSQGRSAPTDNIDEILKRIAISYVKETIGKSSNVDDAARSVGVGAEEIRILCAALSIPVPGEPQKIEPVELPGTNLLTNNNYEPEAILDYNGQSPYILLVDKSEHQLHLLQYRNGKRSLVRTFECKTGKNHGDKMEEGDNRTPEGAFLLINKYSRSQILRMVGRDQAYQYGDMAFVTDFPNNIDRLHGKNGGGIWLHGTDKPFDETSQNDTRGCVVTTNEDINTLSSYIKLNITPIIIVDKLKMLDNEAAEIERKKVIDTVESWRSAWENKNLQSYTSHYASSFTGQGMNKKQWIDRKKIIFDAYRINHVKVENFSIFRHNSGLVVQFIQDYSAENIRQNKGLKTLYLVPQNNSWVIVAEHIRNL